MQAVADRARLLAAVTLMAFKRSHESRMFMRAAFGAKSNGTGLKPAPISVLLTSQEILTIFLLPCP